MTATQAKRAADEFNKPTELAAVFDTIAARANAGFYTADIIGTTRRVVECLPDLGYELLNRRAGANNTIDVRVSWS